MKETKCRYLGFGLGWCVRYLPCHILLWVVTAEAVQASPATIREQQRSPHLTRPQTPDTQPRSSVARTLRTVATLQRIKGWENIRNSHFFTQNAFVILILTSWSLNWKGKIVLSIEMMFAGGDQVWKFSLQLQQPSAAGSRVTESRSGNNLRRIFHISSGRWCEHFLTCRYLHAFFYFCLLNNLDAKEWLETVENWITTDKTICSNWQLSECT